jgi:hypothetical protein
LIKFLGVRSFDAASVAPSDLVIAAATTKNNWQDWKIVVEEKGPFNNEMLADPTRWKTDRILSVMVQEEPKTVGNPSPLRIIDYRLDAAPGAKK